MKQPYKSYFLSYSSSEFREAQNSLNASAKEYGNFTDIDPWNDDRLKKTAFYQENKGILDEPRGNGYWIWKPFIILEKLKEIKEGEFVVYWDVGRSNSTNKLKRDINGALRWCAKHNNGMILGVNLFYHGPNKKWTKRDCFVYMDCDHDKYRNHCQIQATFSIWQKNASSIHFIEQWLHYCKDRRIVTDDPSSCGLPDDESFRDHRHDQSVLTNLVIKENLQCFPYPFNVNQIIDKDLNELIRIIDTPYPIVFLEVMKRKLKKQLSSIKQKIMHSRNR